MNLTKVTARQFARILDKQGRIVKDCKTGFEYKVMFSKAGATNMQDKIKISYAEGTPLGKGDIVEYKDNFYILINQDNISSDVYRSSICIKCNCKWNIDGKPYYLVASELTGSNPKFGAVTNEVNGTITLYTTKSNILNINDNIVDFGGAFQCVNKFTIDNLTYYSLTKRLMNTSDWTLELGVENTEVEVGQELQLNPSMKSSSGDTWIAPSTDSDISYYYTSTDKDVATVDSNGLITFVGNGSVTINITGLMKVDDMTIWADAGITFTVIAVGIPFATITGVMDQDGDNVPFETEMPWYYKEYTLTAHYFNPDGIEENKAVTRWEVYSTNYGQYNIPSNNQIESLYDIENGNSRIAKAELQFDGNSVHVVPDLNGSTSAKSWAYDPLIFKAYFWDGTFASLSVIPRV